MKESVQFNKETKVSTLYTTLRDEALAKGPHGRLPSVRELCQSLGISRTTLDQVLDDLEAHDIIYRKHGSGLFVSPKLFRNTIAIIINTQWLADSTHPSPIWGRLWGLFAEEAQRRASIKNEYYCLHAVMPDDKEIPLSEELVHLAQTGRLQGVLNIGVPHAAVHWLTAQGIPCVSFFVYGPWTLMLDYKEMFRLAIAHLAEQGCRRIGLWANHASITSLTMSGNLASEGEAYRKYLAEYGLEYDRELVRPIHDSQSSEQEWYTLTKQEQGYDNAQKVFGDASSAKPDGLIIMDDMITEGALVSLLAQGVRLGEDLKIVTHANAGMMKYLSHLPGIAVIEYDPQTVVQKMFEILDAQLGGQPVAHQAIMISPRWRRV